MEHWKQYDQYDDRHNNIQKNRKKFARWAFHAELSETTA